MKQNYQPLNDPRQSAPTTHETPAPSPVTPSLSLLGAKPTSSSSFSSSSFSGMSSDAATVTSSSPSYRSPPSPSLPSQLSPDGFPYRRFSFSSSVSLASQGGHGCSRERLKYSQRHQDCRSSSFSPSCCPSPYSFPPYSMSTSSIRRSPSSSLSSSLSTTTTTTIRATCPSSLLSDPRFSSSSLSSSSSSPLCSQKDSICLSVRRRSYLYKGGKKSEEVTPSQASSRVVSVGDHSSSFSLEHRDELNSTASEENRKEQQEGERHQRFVGSSSSSFSSSSCMAGLSSSSSFETSAYSSPKIHSSSTSIQQASWSLQGDLGEDDRQGHSLHSNMRDHQEEKEHDGGEIKTDVGGQERRDEHSSMSSCPSSFFTTGASSHSFSSSSSFTSSSSSSLLDQSSPALFTFSSSSSPSFSSSSSFSSSIRSRRCASCDGQRGDCSPYERGEVIEGRRGERRRRRRGKSGDLRHHRHSFASGLSSSSFFFTSPQSISLDSRERAPHEALSFLRHDVSPLSLPSPATTGVISSSKSKRESITLRRDQLLQQASQEAQSLPSSSSSTCPNSAVTSPRRLQVGASLSSSTSFTDFSFSSLNFPASISTAASFSSYASSSSACNVSLSVSRPSWSSLTRRRPQNGFEEKASPWDRKNGQKSETTVDHKESLEKLLLHRQGEGGHRQKKTFLREKEHSKRRGSCPSYLLGCRSEFCPLSRNERWSQTVDTPDSERRKIGSLSSFSSDQETYTKRNRSQSLLLSEVLVSSRQNGLPFREKGTRFSYSERPHKRSPCKEVYTSTREVMGEISARKKRGERDEATREDSPSSLSSLLPWNCPEGVELEKRELAYSQYNSLGVCTADRSILNRGTTRPSSPSPTGREARDDSESCKEAQEALRPAPKEEEAKEVQEKQGQEREFRTVSVASQHTIKTSLVLPRPRKRRGGDKTSLSTRVASGDLNGTLKKIEGKEEEEDDQEKGERCDKRRDGVVSVENPTSLNRSVLKTNAEEKNVFSSLEEKAHSDAEPRCLCHSREHSFSPSPSAFSYKDGEEENKETQRKTVAEKIVKEADDPARSLAAGLSKTSSCSSQSPLSSLDSARGAAATRLQRKWRGRNLARSLEFEALVLCLLKVRHLAAISIQKVYRGWKLRGVLTEEMRSLVITWKEKENEEGEDDEEKNEERKARLHGEKKKERYKRIQQTPSQEERSHSEKQEDDEEDYQTSRSRRALLARHKERAVELVGTFGDRPWEKRFPMSFCSIRECYVAAFPYTPGVHTFKFIIDGSYRCSSRYAQVADEHGNVNNSVEISDPIPPALRLVPRFPWRCSRRRSNRSSTETAEDDSRSRCYSVCSTSSIASSIGSMQDEDQKKLEMNEKQQIRRRGHKEEAKEECEIPTNSRDTDGPFSDHRRRNCMSLNEQIGVLDDKREGKDSTQPSREVLPSRHCRYEETRMKDGKGVRERSDGRLESEMSRLGRVDTDQRGGSTTHRTLCRENKRKDKRNHVSSETENEDKKEKAKEEECCKKKKSIEFAGNRALTRTSSFPGKDSKTATNGDSTSKTSKNQSGALSEREEFFFNPSWSESGSDVKRQTMLASPGEMRPRDDENTKEQQKSEEGRRRNERACGIQKESVLEDSSPNITGGEGTMKADSKAVKNSGDREERQHDAPDQKRQHSSHVVQPESDVKKKEKRFLKSTRVSFYRISSAPSDLSFKPEESPALPSHPSQTNSTLTSTRFWGDHEEERRDTSKCKDLRECLSPLLSQLRGRPPSTKEQQLSRRGIGGEEKGLGLSSRCFSHSDNLMNAIIEEERENEEEECDNEREPDGAYNNYCAAVPVNRTVSDRGPCSVRFLGKEKSSSDDEDEVFLLRFPSWSSRSRRARHERSSRMLPALWSKPWGVGDGGGEKFARFSSGSSPGTILSIERQTAIFKSSRPCAESLFQKRLLALSEDRRRRIIHEPHCQRGNRSCLSSGTAGKENGKTTTIEECQANGVDDDDDRRDRQRTHSTEKQEDRVYSAEEVVRNRTPSGEGNISYSTDGVQPLLSKLKVTGESSDGPPAVGSTCGGGVCVRKNEAVKRVGPVCSSIKKTEQSIEVQSYVKKAATHEQGEEWKNEAAAAKEFSPSSNKDTAAHGEKNVGEAVKSLKERTLVRRRNSWLNAAGGEGHVSTMSSPVARRPVGSHHGEYLSSLSSGKDSRHNIKKDVGGSPLCRGTNDSNRSTGKQPFAEDRWWMRSDKQKDKSKIVTRRGSLPGGSLLSMGSRSLFEGNGDARDPRVPPPYHSVQQAEAKVTNFLLKRRDDDTKIEDGATTEKGSSGTEPKPLDAKVRIGDVGRGHRVLKWAEKTKRAEAGDQTDEPAACLPPSLPGKPPVPHGSKLKEKPCSTPRKGDIEQGTLVQQGDGGDDNSQQEKFEGAPVGVCIARDSTTTARGVFWAEASEILVAGERTKVVYSDTKVPPGSFLRGRCDASVKSSAITSNSSQVAVQSDVTRYSSTVGEAQLTTEEVKHSQEQKDPRSDSSYYVDETEHDFKFHSGEMDDLPLPPLRRTDDIKVQTQHKLEVLESLKKGGSSGIIQHRFGDTCSAYLSKYQCTREKSSVQYELPSPLQHDAPQFEIWAEEATTDGTATRGKGSRGRVASSEGTGSRETTALSDALKYVKAEKKIEGPPSLGTPESETGQKHLTPVGHTQISILKKQHSTRGVDGLPLRSGEVSAHQAVPVLDQAARTSSSREGDRGESSTICSGGAGDVRNTLSCMDGPRSGGDTCASNAKPLTGTRSYLSHKGFAEASSTSPHKTGCFFPSEEHHHSHLYASRPRASSLLQGAEPSPYHGCNGRPRHHRGGVGCAGEYAVSQGTLNAKRSSSYGEVTCGENSLVQPVTRSMSLHW